MTELTVDTKSQLVSTYTLMTRRRMLLCFGSWRSHLNSDSMLVFPLHVIDVPGHSSHGVNGLLNHLVALLVWIEVLGNFL